jgi:hypothetical protein
LSPQGDDAPSLFSSWFVQVQFTILKLPLPHQKEPILSTKPVSSLHEEAHSPFRNTNIIWKLELRKASPFQNTKAQQSDYAGKAPQENHHAWHDL